MNMNHANNRFLILLILITTITGVDLSKILGGQTNILGGQKVVNSSKCMAVSQLLGACARAIPNVPSKLRACARERLFDQRAQPLPTGLC